MSEFIIASVSSDERYICHDKQGKMSITNRKEKATKYPDAGKAWRVLQTQMPKKRRDGWKVIVLKSEEVEIETQRYRANIDTSSVSQESFDWDNVRNDITESFKEIVAYRERLLKQLSRVEDELCDCEHACEFFKCDASRGYKLYRMIRERRIKRRFLKDELMKSRAVLNMSYTEIVNGGIDDKFKEIGEQSYKPRVLTELFSDVSQNG